MFCRCAKINLAEYSEISEYSKAVVLMWSLLDVLVSEFRWCFTLCLFIILLVQFGLLSDHLLGNSCPLG